MKGKKILVLATASLALVAFLGCWRYSSRAFTNPVRIETVGCPAVGRDGAPLEMVLFEDFRCEGCRDFNRDILPKIQQRYIDPGIVRFTIVPLAFLYGSKPLANAALAVCEIAPDRWLPYVHGLCQGFTEEESAAATQQKLVNLAKATGGIDLLAFKSCVMTNCQESQLEKNLFLARQVMGKQFGTPTLYLNGIPIPTHSFESIQRKIDAHLQGTSP